MESSGKQATHLHHTINFIDLSRVNERRKETGKDKKEMQTMMSLLCVTLSTDERPTMQIVISNRFDGIKQPASLLYFPFDARRFSFKSVTFVISIFQRLKGNDLKANTENTEKIIRNGCQILHGAKATNILCDVVFSLFTRSLISKREKIQQCLLNVEIVPK